MPELPEVETIRTQLQPLVEGRAITEVRILTCDAPGQRRPRLPRSLAADLRERRIKRLDRLGKHLIAHLDDGRAWELHLGMAGLLLYRQPGAPDGDLRCERARVGLGDGAALRFADWRRFGRWKVVEDIEGEFKRIGPDWLSEECTPERLHGRLARRRTPVKAALLDQGVAAGVGNLYADEALWRARIHPTTPANRLGAGDVERLHAAVLETLREAVDARGDSFKAAERGYQYLDAFGEEGRYCRRVYRREGDPCGRCGQLIERDTRAHRIVPGGRASRYCPRCQRA